MSEKLVLSSQVGVSVSKEIDGLEMGVLLDGRAYLTGRALARLCGVQPSTIIQQSQRWLEGERGGKLAKLLLSRGLDPESLFVEVEKPDVIGGKVHAYTDDIATAMLEYYAFEIPKPSDVALANYRRLTQAGLRVFVYRAIGYDPANKVPEQWKHFHDRLSTAVVPFGYFSVFREMSELVLLAIQRDFPFDAKTVPDISVGRIWSSYWVDNGLDAKYGPRTKGQYNFPDYFPQAAANPADVFIYPIDAVGEFRRWLGLEYLPKKFPKYVKDKVKAGALPASTAELLLAEVIPAQLPEKT